MQLMNYSDSINEIPVDQGDQPVLPEDDGLQITDFRKGDFEWWYFDIDDQKSGCFLKIVLHIGTDPLRRKIFPQLALSVNTPEVSVSPTLPFEFSELQADTLQCNISVNNRIKIWSEINEKSEYFIQINVPRFHCNLRFSAILQGWKPHRYKSNYQYGKKKCEFYWVVPQPKAKVEGEFSFDNKIYKIAGATGYHDHNYQKVDREHPLYLDALVNKWYWGKCCFGNYMMIFMDIHLKKSRSQSIMVAEDNRIIYSSDFMTDCSVIKYELDQTLKVEFPESIIIKLLDEHFPFKAVFEFKKILDRKDLLDGVNPVLKYLIKKLITRPAYHGIQVKVRAEINNKLFEGSGNFESMVFRQRVNQLDY